MVIKDGYNSKPTHINITDHGNRKAEFWIEQEGIKVMQQGYQVTSIKGKIPKTQTVTQLVPYETLSYITLDELLDLRYDINKAIQEIVKSC